MSKYRDQHHVPRFLVSNFSGENGLFYFSKNAPHKGIEVRNPKSVFQRRHLYSYQNENGELQTDVESGFLKSLDVAADIVTKKIIDAARNGETPNLAENERDLWDRFFLA